MVNPFGFSPPVPSPPQQTLPELHPIIALSNETPKRNVSRWACLNCRERKIKCDGVQVCRNCKQFSLECVFVKSHRGGRRTRVKKVSPDSSLKSSESTQLSVSNPSLGSTSPHIPNNVTNNSSAFTFENGIPPNTLPMPVAQAQTSQSIANNPYSTFNHTAPNEYPPYAFVPYPLSSEVSGLPPAQRYTSLNALPYSKSRPEVKTKSTTPQITDGAAKRTIIARMWFLVRLEYFLTS